jgi:hypothetical protein
MPSDVFSIVELTGNRREIHLYDRAMPYKSLKAQVEQHFVQRWYPGSKVATLQVLGPRQARGRSRACGRRSSCLGSSRSTCAASRPSTTATSTAPPRSWRRRCGRSARAGQTVDVSWGPEARRGLLVEFEPDWDMEEECRWSCSFVWSQAGQAPARRATVAVDATAAMRQALDNLDNALAEQPAAVAGATSSRLAALANAVRAAGAAFLDGLARAQSETASVGSRVTGVISRVQRATSEAIQNAQALQAIGEILVKAARALCRGAIQDLPYYDLTNLDDVGTALKVEVWRRAVAAESRNVSAEARRSTAAVNERAVPSPLAVVIARDGVSLRALALQHYGNADGAGLIADANGLTSLMPPVGMRIVIPRAPAAGGVREVR